MNSAMRRASSPGSILFVSALAAAWMLSPGIAQAAATHQPAVACGKCHTRNLSDWNTSMHSRAFTAPIFQAVVSRIGLEQSGDPDVGRASIKNGCHFCHAPAAAATGATVLPSATVDNNVTCDFCHTVTSYTRLYNAGYVSVPGDVKYGPFGDSTSPAHGTEPRPLITSSEFCGMCHNVSFGVHKLPFLQTYTEWKKSPYAARDIRCQHCMMGEVQNETAAATGPKRATVYGHSFSGGNVAEGNSAAATRRLRSAATLTLLTDTDTARPGDTIDFTVKIKNSGAGHSLPTGITFVREMLLEVTAQDAQGATTKIFSERFGTILEDNEGRHDRSVAFWKAARIYSDNRLKPLETRVFDKTWRVPSAAKTDYKIVAALTYRSVDPDAAKANGIPLTKPVSMAAARTTLTVSENPAGHISDTLWWLLGGAGVIALTALVFGVIRFLGRTPGD